MKTESPVETLQRFVNYSSWLSNPSDVIAEDLKSAGNESRRQWDTVCYEEREGKLFDPIRKEYVVGIDGKDPAQILVNRDLEKWFLSHDSGISVRISPSGGMYHYPDEQIEIYRITYDYGSMKKRLFGSFRQFHAHFINPEEIRQFIFTEEDSESAIFEIIKWVEKISQNNVEVTLQDTQLRSEQSYYYANRLKSGENPRIIFQDMRETGFLGNNPIGCGGSATVLSLSSDNTLPLENLLGANIFPDVDGWHNGSCRVCGASTWVGPCSICKPCESKL